MLLELDLRMLMYFLSKTMSELLYIYNLQNFRIVFPTLCNYVIFSQIMRLDVARGQLREITRAHNIRSPVIIVLYQLKFSHILRESFP